MLSARGWGVPLTLTSSLPLPPTSLPLTALAALGPKGIVCSCYMAFVSVLPPAFITLSSDLGMLPFPHRSEFSSNCTPLERPSWATLPFLFSLPTSLSHITSLCFLYLHTTCLKFIWGLCLFPSWSWQAPLQGCIRVGSTISVMCVAVLSAPRTEQVQSAMQQGLVTGGGLGEFWGLGGRMSCLCSSTLHMWWWAVLKWPSWSKWAVPSSDQSILIEELNQVKPQLSWVGVMP